MQNTYNITQAQKNLPKIVRSLNEAGIVGIKSREDTKAFLISSEQMESIIETMEVLLNPKAIDTFRDYANGKLNFVDFK